MADLHSKVTLRPRSKLERVIELLEKVYPALPRPRGDGLAEELSLHLARAGATPALAAALASDIVAGKHDRESARTHLAALLGDNEQASDHALLLSGLGEQIAPPPDAQRVAARLGYPGSCYAALGRALDAELPEGDRREVAWRAHVALSQHGRSQCTADRPQCETCPLTASCSFVPRAAGLPDSRG